jgi:hypothetical protein
MKNPDATESPIKIGALYIQPYKDWHQDYTMMLKSTVGLFQSVSHASMKDCFRVHHLLNDAPSWISINSCTLYHGRYIVRADQAEIAFRLGKPSVGEYQYRHDHGRALAARNLSDVFDPGELVNETFKTLFLIRTFSDRTREVCVWTIGLNSIEGLQ